MLPVLVATSAVFCLTVDGFTSGANLSNMARFFAPLFVAAVGATFVFLLGEIDLSIGSILSLASVLAALAMRRAGSVWLGRPRASPRAWRSAPSTASPWPCCASRPSSTRSACC